SLTSPWDLQTALSQPNSVVNGGDTIWLHGGTYTGRFISTINSTKPDKKILVSSISGERVTLNGNTKSARKSVLEVQGARVRYQNFEITFLGDYDRHFGQPGFQKVNGLFHTLGEDCEFSGLRIHNNPGVGVGSWKATGGTLIEFCKVYNNGHLRKKKGVGEGFYVQNQSDKERIIRNNFIFNNYYKGIEVWSASSGVGFEFVKNVRLENNIIFNNGTPAGKHVDNLIIASDDKEGINVARNIKVLNNVLYHNINHEDNSNYGHGASLTLGYNFKSPVRDIVVNDNLIIGKNNALRLFHVKSMNFKRNTIYSGYVNFFNSTLNSINKDSWAVSNNNYYTRKFKAFRVIKTRDFSLDEWQKEYKTELHSEWNPLKNFKMNKALYIEKSPDNPKSYEIAVLNSEAKSVQVDFTSSGIEENTNYKILDLASGDIIESGQLKSNKQIEIKPGNHNGTALNFGVYTIEFEEVSKKRKSLFERLFGWIF
ncbi:MAG: hypothetical protein HKM99_06570, partial [Flavobacteriaceae bacterium]|nr:hypothetical protein [Flavobacteriaceae bacterium]